MGERIKNVPVHFWVSPNTDEIVRNIAKAEDRSLSSVYRELVEKGLSAAGYQAGGEDMLTTIKDALQEILRPQIERLASINAKGTQISAAAFFLAAYNGRLSTPDYLKDEYDEVALQARKLGIEYLKLAKEKNLDEFIERGFNRMQEDAE